MAGVPKVLLSTAEAAEALGVSQATYDTRVAPFVRLLELNGTRFVHIGDLLRFIDYELMLPEAQRTIPVKVL